MSKEQHKTSTPHPDHAPGWNENLASASEAAIKVRSTIPSYYVQTLTSTLQQADQAGVTPGDLQEKTVKYVKERHHATDSATTTEPGVSTSRMAHTSSGEASNKRDEIDGPLKTAHGKKST